MKSLMNAKLFAQLSLSKKKKNGERRSLQKITNTMSTTGGKVLANNNVSIPYNADC